MTWFYRLSNEAVADIAAAADWYDRQTHGLGRKFIEEVDRTLDRMARFPHAYVEVHRSVRRIRVGRFPYFIAYQVFVGELVVIGVFAEARLPLHHRRRLAEA